MLKHEYLHSLPKSAPSTGLNANFSSTTYPTSIAVGCMHNATLTVLGCHGINFRSACGKLGCWWRLCDVYNRSIQTRILCANTFSGTDMSMRVIGHCYYTDLLHLNLYSLVMTLSLHSSGTGEKFAVHATSRKQGCLWQLCNFTASTCCCCCCSIVSLLYGTMSLIKREDINRNWFRFVDMMNSKFPYFK